MRGGDSTSAEFLEDALVFDLSSRGARWESLPAPPFQRRALAVAAIKGKVYVLGGLEEDGKVVKSVAIYDPATKAWTQGPELPGSKTAGFCSLGVRRRRQALCQRDRRPVAPAQRIRRRWEVAGKLAVPRLTHRLLPGIAGDLLAVGGNFAGAPVRFVESISITGSLD